jgi:broad specificity phosphatase PhoE
MLTKKPFYFLRHGETEWNRNRRWQGISDIPLNNTGIEQAEALQPLIADLGIQTICASPLQRAFVTAELASEGLDIPIHAIDGLKEVSFGPYEGVNHYEVDWIQDWLKGDHVEGVEGYDAFITRCVEAINQALNFDGPVLIVAHGGVFWSVRHHGQLDPELRAWNCSLFHIQPPLGDHPAWQHTALNEESTAPIVG